MRILIGDANGVSVRIVVSSNRGTSIDVDVDSSDVTMSIGDGAGARALRIASKGGRKSRDRADGDPVSPEMEAAAVEAFLGGADVDRLGRSLAEVYRAMEGVRRGGAVLDDDGDGS